MHTEIPHGLEEHLASLEGVYVDIYPTWILTEWLFN
jgi:hypothetical protein